MRAIIVDGSEKEIAALVVALQERQSVGMVEYVYPLGDSEKSPANCEAILQKIVHEGGEERWIRSR